MSYALYPITRLRRHPRGIYDFLAELLWWHLREFNLLPIARRVL